MEFDFASLAFGGEKHIVAWDSKRISHLKPDDQRNLEKLLDEFGKKSALAQGLQAPVTDIHRLRSTDQRLYLYMYRQSTKTVVLGGLKVGTKRLFVRTATAELREIEPMCVLDFYVHESCQRQGVGKALFEHFLQTEGWDPSCLAYDRPSPKLQAFLKKHYGLHEYVPQSNNFVVFNRYFELNPPAGSGSRASGSQARPACRGATASTVSTPLLPGPRSTPPPDLAHPPLPVHPAWGGHPTQPVAVASPSAVRPPAPLGSSPSLGRRWAASTFGSQAPPFPAQPLGQDASSSGGGGGDRCYGLSDSLDAFSRERQGQTPNGTLPHAHPAPWEAAGAGPLGPGCAAPGGAGGQPPASRGGYSYRPPWAVDPEPAGPSGAGYAGTPPARTPPPMGGFGAPPRSPLQAITGGGAGGEGPHTRALQQQLAAMQPDGSGGGAFGTEGGALARMDPGARGATPLGAGRLGTGAEDAAAAGRSTARMMAVAQRSGAGAADCLVW